MPDTLASETRCLGIGLWYYSSIVLQIVASPDRSTRFARLRSETVYRTCRPCEAAAARTAEQRVERDGHAADRERAVQRLGDVGREQAGDRGVVKPNPSPT